MVKWELDWWWCFMGMDESPVCVHAIRPQPPLFSAFLPSLKEVLWGPLSNTDPDSFAMQIHDDLGAPRDRHGVRMWRKRAVTNRQFLTGREWEHAAFCMFGTHTMLSLVPSRVWSCQLRYQPVSSAPVSAPQCPTRKSSPCHSVAVQPAQLPKTRSTCEQYENNMLYVSYNDCCSVAATVIACRTAELCMRPPSSLLLLRFGLQLVGVTI